MCFEKQGLNFSQYRLGNVAITNNAKMEVAQNNMFLFHSYYLYIEIQDPKLTEASPSVTHWLPPQKERKTENTHSLLTASPRCGTYHLYSYFISKIESHGYAQLQWKMESLLHQDMRGIG